MNIININFLSEVPENFTGIAEFSNKDKCWFKEGLYHREGGPAIEWINGHKEWYKEGTRHRLDGPAIINSIKNNFTNYKLCENEIDYLYHWLFLKIKYVFNYYYSGYISKQISENDLSKYFRDIVSKYNIFTYGIVCTDGKYFTKHEYKVLKKLLRSDQSALKAIKKERLEKKISAQKISILKTSIDK